VSEGMSRMPHRIQEVCIRSAFDGALIFMEECYMSKDDDIFDLFEELSQERETKRDKKHQEELLAQQAKRPEIIDTGEECVGG
jgi:hypothetical protein